MTDIVEFTDFSIEKHKLILRNHTGVVPLHWTNISFPIREYIQENDPRIINFLQKNTSGKYAVNATAETLKDFDVRLTLHIFLEKPEDAFMIKLLGINEVLEKNDKLF